MYIVKRKIKRKSTLQTYYLIAETIYKNEKPRQKILKYLGTAENILKVFRKKVKKK